MIKLLVLCTGNSARSILGEALINAKGENRLSGWSAGSRPKGAVHPLAFETLQRHGRDITGLASKSWDVYAREGAPAFDAVITVCDSAAAEACPVWPGAPVTAHWGLPDPAAIEDEAEARAAFEAVYQAISANIDALLAHPLETLGRDGLRAALREASAAGAP